MLEDRHRLGALRFAALAVTMAAVALCVMTKKAARADGQTARSPVPPVDAINLADVIRLREKLAHRAVHVVQGVKSDASELSAEEMEAVSALGALRAEEGCEALVAIVTIRGPAPATQVFVSPDGGLARLTRSVLDDSPAGLALAEIGLPALRAIQRDMEDPTRPKPSDLRLRSLRAGVLARPRVGPCPGVCHGGEAPRAAGSGRDLRPSAGAASDESGPGGVASRLADNAAARQGGQMTGEVARPVAGQGVCRHSCGGTAGRSSSVESGLRAAHRHAGEDAAGSENAPRPVCDGSAADYHGSVTAVGVASAL